ncbi:hypothetical protein PENDEC_c022G07151 [Penicillium decumbens]|uniref:SAM domain-containing protein n=1 Tax=Penicillium decumbens TaxID=69771 RepID=A0A1V6P145_PENDC|nr:hypothetical protein PENDEC_c022G07151 [Penicillium decumbens]
MDSLRFRRRAVPASLSTKGHQRFYPINTRANRPLSSAVTEFSDTDFEASDSDEESLRQSLNSLAYDSNTTLSTPELPTPDDVLRRQVYIHVDEAKPTMEGPRGPHLTSPRNSEFDSEPEPSTASIDLFLERSPLQSGFAKSIDTPNKFPFSPNTPRRFPFSPKTPKAFPTVHPDVSQVSEEEIRSWKPSQVAHWLHIAHFNDAVIERFLINDITGAVLLSLETDDLKELDIHSFGIRHNIMSSIKHLKATMGKDAAPLTDCQTSQGTSSAGRSSPERRSYVMSVSPNGEILSNHAFGQQMGTQITPAESVSIVGIEQVLPRPHRCSKGEECPTYKKRQRQIAQIKADFPGVVIQNGTIITGNPGNPETARNMLQRISNSEPSVVASSDVFGPNTGPKLSEAALQEVQKVDRQKAIEDFLKNQHIDEPYPKPAPPRLNTSDLSPVNQANGKTNMAAKLAMLPGLNIPDSTSPNTEDMTTAITTPNRASQTFGSPTAVQQYGPFTQLGSMHSGDYFQKYRVGTPASEMDVPITAIPDGPIPRDTSQSVPPDMQYGSLFPPYRDPIARSATARPRAPQVLRQVHEDKALTPIDNPADLIRSPRVQHHGYSASQSSQSSLISDPDVTHAGYMKKRKTTKLVAHHWDKKHFTLRGTSLDMHDTEEAAKRRSRALASIDVDDYAVACSSLATSSKLTAAFKRSILRGGKNLNSGRDNSAFAFSLIPASKENEKRALLGNGNKTHHFAVDTREARIDWMRELMLARALKKGKDSGEEIRVNGNLI